MKYLELNRITKLYFGYEEIARSLDITPQSARVSANRYVKSGLLIRVKRNIYVLKERWNILEKEEKFVLANIAQVPSYISLMTALDYYGITTQIQRDFIESVAVKRTKEILVEKTFFNYTKIDKRSYSGFERRKGFFIAVPEKAFLDAVYLASLKRYSFDLSSVDLSKFDPEKIKRLAGAFPLKVTQLLEGNGYSPKT